MKKRNNRQSAIANCQLEMLAVQKLLEDFLREETKQSAIGNRQLEMRYAI